MRAALALAALLLPAAAFAQATADVSVLAHAVARGERLDTDDFAVEARSTAQGRGALSPGDAAGKEATRNLAAGSVVRASDVIVPRLVKRGEPVSVVVRSGSLAIATPGRALGGGAAGDLVRVVILATNRTLDGIVEAAGEVRVGR